MLWSICWVGAYTFTRVRARSRRFSPFRGRNVPSAKSFIHVRSMATYLIAA